MIQTCGLIRFMRYFKQYVQNGNFQNKIKYRPTSRNRKTILSYAIFLNNYDFFLNKIIISDLFRNVGNQNQNIFVSIQDLKIKNRKRWLKTSFIIFRLHLQTLVFMLLEELWLWIGYTCNRESHIFKKKDSTAMSVIN